MNCKKILLGAVMAALFGPAFNASAGTDTTSFNVKIVITSTCTISTTAPTDVDFGSNASTAVNKSAQGLLNVNCTKLTPYTVSLGNGNNGSSATTRNMKGGSGADLIPYQLYQDSALGTIWGSTTGVGGNVKGGTGTGTNQPITVYGQATIASANPPAGNYSDVIQATVTY